MTISSETNRGFAHMTGLDNTDATVNVRAAGDGWPPGSRLPR